MRANPTPEPGDLDRQAFANGTEWEFWAARNCSSGRGCIHDSTYGQADEELAAEVNCPLISVALFTAVTPHEWLPLVDDSWTGPCTAYVEERTEPTPDPVVTVDLFGTYAEEPVR